MKNFWQKLKKPIYVLAPMAGVTDSAFRQICKAYGADVVYSEMASATALVYNPKKTLELLKFSKMERPYVVQLFGSKPDHFAKAVKIVEKKIKPDGIDINFGCPVKKVQRQGAGAALMKNLKLAREIVEAVIDNTSLPVSIKIRSQVESITALDFLKEMADLDIKAVMIHGRTMAQGQSGEVDWRMIKQARPLVRGVLLANGGVGTHGNVSAAYEDARDLLQITGADGIGIGQGTLGKPWIFQEVRSKKLEIRSRGALPCAHSKEVIFKVALKHAKLAEKLKGKQAAPATPCLRGGRGIVEMRKHLCWYVSGLPNAGNLREKLIRVESLGDVKRILR